MGPNRLIAANLAALKFVARDYMNKAMAQFGGHECALARERSNLMASIALRPVQEVGRAQAEFLVRVAGTVGDVRGWPDTFRANRNDAVVQLAVMLGLEVQLGDDGLLYALDNDGAVLEFAPEEKA